MLRHFIAHDPDHRRAMSTDEEREWHYCCFYNNSFIEEATLCFLNAFDTRFILQYAVAAGNLYRAALKGFYPEYVYGFVQVKSENKFSRLSSRINNFEPLHKFFKYLIKKDNPDSPEVFIVPLDETKVRQDLMRAIALGVIFVDWDFDGKNLGGSIDKPAIVKIDPEAAFSPEFFQQDLSDIKKLTQFNKFKESKFFGIIIECFTAGLSQKIQWESYISDEDKADAVAEKFLRGFLTSDAAKKDYELALTEILDNLSADMTRDIFEKNISDEFALSRNILIQATNERLHYFRQALTNDNQQENNNNRESIQSFYVKGTWTYTNALNQAFEKGDFKKIQAILNFICSPHTPGKLRGRNYTLAGDIYFKLQNYEKAKEHYLSAIENLYKPDHFDSLIHAHKQLAEIYLLLPQPDKKTRMENLQNAIKHSQLAKSVWLKNLSQNPVIDDKKLEDVQRLRKFIADIEERNIAVSTSELLQNEWVYCTGYNPAFIREKTLCFLNCFDLRFILQYAVAAGNLYRAALKGLYPVYIFDSVEIADETKFARLSQRIENFESIGKFFTIKIDPANTRQSVVITPLDATKIRSDLMRAIALGVVFMDGDFDGNNIGGPIDNINRAIVKIDPEAAFAPEFFQQDLSEIKKLIQFDEFIKSKFFTSILTNLINSLANEILLADENGDVDFGDAEDMAKSFIKDFLISDETKKDYEDALHEVVTNLSDVICQSIFIENIADEFSEARSILIQATKERLHYFRQALTNNNQQENNNNVPENNRESIQSQYAKRNLTYTVALDQAFAEGDFKKLKTMLDFMCPFDYDLECSSAGSNYIAAGDFYLKIQNYERAKEHYLRALTHLKYDRPLMIKVYKQLAEIYVLLPKPDNKTKMKNFQDALDVLNLSKIILRQDQSQDAEVDYALGNVYFWMGNFSEAKKYYELAKPGLPKNSELTRNLTTASLIVEHQSAPTIGLFPPQVGTKRRIDEMNNNNENRNVME